MDNILPPMQLENNTPLANIYFVHCIFNQFAGKAPLFYLVLIYICRQPDLHFLTFIINFLLTIEYFFPILKYERNIQYSIMEEIPMSEGNIATIKKRACVIQTLIRIIFILGVIIFLAVILITLLLFFASPENFNAVKENLNWHISYSLSNHSSFFIEVPFKIMQPLDNSLFSAKYAALTSLLSLLIKLSVTLYGINQIAKILEFPANGLTPFVLANVQSLQKLALTIIIYSVILDLLVNLAYSVFVTKIFNINFANIHFSGLLVGGLILIIADIFQYGVFLQNEFDTTL